MILLWITMMFIIIMIVTKEKEKKKNNANKSKKANEYNEVKYPAYPVVRKTTLTVSQLKDELHRAEFDIFVKSTFPGLLYWEPLEEDVAENYNRDHMIKVTYADGTYEIVVIHVKDGIPEYNRTSDEIQETICGAEEWIDDNRDMLMEKYENKEDFVLDEDYFPAGDINEIIERISETGMFNIFHEDKQIKFFAVE